MADQSPHANELCPTHHTAMVRQQEHIGDGKTRLSEPFCPACRSIEAGEMKPPEQALRPQPSANAE